MNKHERFRAMLAGDPVDQVPAGFWYHFGRESHGGQAMARAHLAYYRDTDLDIMKVMNDEGYAPIGRLRIADAGDWRALEPTPLADAHFQSHLDGLRRIVQAVGSEVPVMTTAFNPYNQAMAIIRAGNPALGTTDLARAELLRQLRTDPAPVQRALGIIAEDLAAFFRACITQAGAHGIYYSAQGGERSVMSDDEHARFFRPYDLHVIEALAGVAQFVVGHFCGPDISLERFRGYPVHLANWAHQSGNLSLREGRELFGLPILGGMDERGPLVTGPQEAIAAEVRAALAEMGTRGFMLGAGCTVPGDIDHEHLRHARRVCVAASRRA